MKLSNIENILKESDVSDSISYQEREHKYIPSAVLIPLFERNNETFILFTKRSDKVKHHKGQISFPGGKFELDDIDLEKTALRETYEEIGLDPENIKIISKLQEIITITDFIVTPFVGIFDYPEKFKVSRDEISLIIEAPLNHFKNKSIRWVEEREVKGEKIQIHFFSYQDHIIWGATGKILFDFISKLE